MTNLPGRSYAIVFTFRSGTQFRTTDVRRGFWDYDNNAWFEPSCSRAPVIKRSFAQPLRGLPSFDRVTCDLVNLYESNFLDLLNGCEVAIYHQIQDASNGYRAKLGDVIWTGRGRRSRAARRTGTGIRVEMVDSRAFVLDGASGRKRTNAAEEGTYDPPERDLDEPIVVRLGDYTVPGLGARALCRDKGTNDASNDPLFVYNDVLDKDGNTMSTTSSGFQVYAIDSNSFESARDAELAGLSSGYYNVTSHVINADHTVAEFQIDRSAFDADGSIPFTYDAETTLIYCQFKGPISNDATLTSGISLDRDGPLSIAATIYVEYAGLDPSLIDNTVIEAIDNAAPPVYDELTDDLADDLASLCSNMFLQERVTPDGKITWRTRWDLTAFSSDWTIDTRHHVDFPDESWGQTDPFYTTLTLERQHPPYAPDSILAAGPVTDSLLVASNDDQDIAETEEARWISNIIDLKTLASYKIRIQGNRVRYVNIRVALDDIDDQFDIQPGDVVDWTYDEGYATTEPANNILAEVMGVEHDLQDLTTKLTLWDENPEGVYGGIYNADNSTTIATTAVGWTKVTGFTGDFDASNTTPDYANDEIELPHPGYYRFTYSAVLDGDAAVYRLRVGDGSNTAARSEGRVEVKASGRFTARGSLIIKLTAASTTVALYARNTSGARDLDVLNCQLLAERIYPNDEVTGGFA